MRVRAATASDKQSLLTSFKPLFGCWDYLPLVIDEWLEPSPNQETWVVDSGTSDETLVAMAHAYEIEPGDWYLCALRSNPSAGATLIGLGIVLLAREIERELIDRGMQTLRFLTSDYFPESLRLAEVMGFREHFRQVMCWHPLPKTPDPVEGIDIIAPSDADELLKYLSESDAVKAMDGYFSTEWDTRPLREEYLEIALSRGLLIKAVEDDCMLGAAMYWKNDWQPSLILSIMEGTDEALRALFRSAIVSAGNMSCDAIMIMHLSVEEVNRRQRLFGLNEDGVNVPSFILTREELQSRNSARTEVPSDESP